jgi:photosystem II stability/assembly factor-like uncharacterized protein
MRKILLLAITALSFSNLPAQQWVKTNGPYGGEIKDIIVHPSGSVYALGGNQNRTVFKSTDNGNTWVANPPSVSNNGNRIEDLYLGPAGVVFALENSNLYKTTDDGATWTKVNSGTGVAAGGFDNGQVFAINFLSGTYYILGYDYNDGEYTVFRSTNNGLTWTKGHQGSYFSQLVSNSNGDVYALYGGETWRSSDDGTSFVKLPLSVPPDLLSYATSLTVKSDGTQVAISTYNSSMYTLTAPFASATWTAVSELGIDNPTNYGSNSKLLYSANNSTLFLFDDLNNKFYSILTSTLVSGTWVKQSSTFLNASGDDIICAASRDASNLYVGSQRLGVYKTINGGAGWTEVNTGIENLPMENLVAADNGDLIAAGLFAFRSTNDGQTWTKISTSAAEYTVIKATTGSPRPLLLLAIGGGLSYKSINNGANWTAIADSPTANTFVSPDGTKILGYSYNKLYYSSNQGTSWSAALAVTGLPASVNFDVANYNSVVMDQNANIYAYLYAGAVGYKFYKIVPNSTTAPVSATATEIPLATIGTTYVQDMKFLNNKIYVTGYGSSSDVICISSDGGVSWTQKQVQNSGRLDMDPVNNYIFLTTNSSSTYTVNLSRDEGTTFTSGSVVLNPNQTSVYGIAVDPTGIVFAGFAGSSVWKTTSTIITPATPTNLINSGSATDRITLRFDDNAFNEQYYYVEKFNGSSYDSVYRTGSASSTSNHVYVDIANLQPGTSYQFKVYAKNGAGKSGEATITTSTLQACASTIPDNRSWSGNVNGTTALTNVSIKAFSDGVYTISDVNNGLVTDAGQPAPGTFSIGCAASAPNTYFQASYPLVPDGNGTWSSGTNTLVLKWHTEPWLSTQVAGTVTLVMNSADPTPAAPANAAAYVYNNTSIEVNWQAVAFEKSFTIERKTGVGGTFAVVGTVQYPNVSFLDPGPFTLDATYVYRIKSANANTPAAGVSPYSNEALIVFKKPNFVLAETIVNSAPINSLSTMWADFNKDGFDDLIVTKFDLFTVSSSLPAFFQNDGAGNFSLASTNLAASRYLNGTAADYNNDGNLDLFYSTFGDQNKLYTGAGTFTFSQVTPSPVEGTGDGDFEDASFAASWIDYDNDGLLDLFVGRSGNNYSELYKQNTDHSFTKVTTAGELVSSYLNVFGTAWADYDNDGDQDVFLIDQGDNAANKLFRNNDDGTFTKITGSVFDADATLSGQVASWGDFDNDQDPDLFVGDQAGSNLLYRNNGNGTFTKLSTGFDVTTAGNTLGSNWIDVNNDGFIDLLVAGQSGNILFTNANGTSFTRVAGEKISDARLFSISASSSDYNNDGFVDMVLSRTTLGNDDGLGPPQNTLLFKNNNTTGNWLKIRLVGTVSNKSAIGARIKVVTGTKNQIREVQSHIDVGSQNSLTQHFGLAASTKADNIVITWPSGVVQTLTNVNANTTVTVTEDGLGPVVTSRTPAASATAVAIATTVSMTLDETSTAVAGKKLKIAKVSAPATIIHDLDLSAAAVSGNTYTFTLPAPLEFTTNYTITVDAGAFKDVYGNDFLGVAAGTWTFTTAAPPDVTAPVITFAPLATTLEKNFAAISIEITVADDRTVTSVDFNHRKISEKTFQALALTFNAGTGKWQGQVQNTFTDEMGFEYFISASDGPNTGRLPLDNSTYFKSTLTFAGSPPTLTLPSGATKTSWKIVSIPHTLPDAQISTIFTQLGAPDKTKWRLIRYTKTTSEAWLEYPTSFTTIERGKGYFINTDPGGLVSLLNAAAPVSTRDNLYQMSLVAGWNQIGNPYTVPINWADVAAYNPTAQIGELVKFNNGIYTSTDAQLPPLQGAFVFADAAATIKIPFIGQNTPGGGRKGYASLGNDIGADEWALSLDVVQGDLTNSMGSIGMAKEAHISLDSYDAVTPPRFFDYLEMNFNHPEHMAKRFTRDVVPTRENYTWDFSVNSNLPGIAELRWNNVPLRSSGKDLFLLDVGAQKLVNMKEIATFRFDPKEGGKFRIYYGQDLKIAPERVQLGKAYPNPTNGLTTIGFSLPETGGLNQSVILDIADGMGRVIGTIAETRLNPGYHESAFDAREIMTGFYTYRLTVKNLRGQTIEVNKLIIK